MNDRFDSELADATAAAWRARSQIRSLDRSGLDAKQRRAFRLLSNRLEEAVDGVAKSFETPVQTVYAAVRRALSELNKIEQGALSEAQRQCVDEATSALHEAEDALHEPFWRG